MLLFLPACSVFNPSSVVEPSTPSAQAEMLLRDHQALPNGYIVRYNAENCAQGNGTGGSQALEIKETYQDLAELDADNMERFYDVETRAVSSQFAPAVAQGDLKMLNQVNGKVASSLSEVSQNYPSQFSGNLVSQLTVNQGASVAQYSEQNQHMSDGGTGKGKGKGKAAMSTAQMSPSQGKVAGGYLPAQGLGLSTQRVAAPTQGKGLEYGQVSQARGKGKSKGTAQAMAPQQQGAFGGAYHDDVAQGASASFQGSGGVHQASSGKAQQGVSQSGQAWPGQHAQQSSAELPSTTKHILPSHHQGAQQAHTYGGSSPDQGVSSELSSTSTFAAPGCPYLADMIRDEFRPAVSSSHFDNHYWGYFTAPREIAVGDNIYFLYNKPGCSTASWCPEFH